MVSQLIDVNEEVNDKGHTVEELWDQALLRMQKYQRKITRYYDKNVRHMDSPILFSFLISSYFSSLTLVKSTIQTESKL